ncbi:TetR/AcrR family transcriptional regulator [Streptomyces sp. NPDC047002]|uniref:TetR/AcrR family transcriptional regulator n=1 Tax=Streptomyces sp. NPDC047002 TaxID=3155475 RepID=UPI0034545B88
MARPRKFAEDDVLRDVREQFWRTGYDGTSMQDLCAATGLGSQSLYGAFGGKHELFVRALGTYCDAQVEGLGSGLARHEDPWDALMAAVVFDASDGRLPLGPDGCFLASSVAALARRDDSVRTLSERTYRAITGLLRAELARAGRTGRLKAGVDLDEAALALLTAMQGIEFLSKSGLEARTLAAARASTVAMLTAAYAVPAAGQEPAAVPAA